MKHDVLIKVQIIYIIQLSKTIIAFHPEVIWTDNTELEIVIRKVN